MWGNGDKMKMGVGVGVGWERELKGGALANTFADRLAPSPFPPRGGTDT